MKKDELREILMKKISKKSIKELLRLLDIRCKSCIYLKYHSNHFGYWCTSGFEINGSCLHKACVDIKFKD